MTTVAAVIPSIPPRATMLARALASVEAQTRRPDEIIVHLDESGEGAAAARNHALADVTSEWVALLDDDDEWLPHHVADLLACAEATQADLIYPMWIGANAETLRPHLEQPFDEAKRDYILNHGNFIPVTVLIRTEALRAVGGFQVAPHGFPDDTAHQHTVAAEDWWTWCNLLRAGYTFAHHPQITWRYNLHSGHTSGWSWQKM